ncbi:MAG: tetratricopeptide repeat protein, partial [Bacteroidia bacterium]
MKYIYLFFTAYFLCSYDAVAQDIETVINLSDARFTVRARHSLNFVGDEEIVYYVDNHTSRDYKLVVNIDINYTCSKSASYILGVNKIILVKANSTWNGNRDGDWYHSNSTNDKNCVITKNGIKTTVSHISVRLGEVIDYTAEKELEANKNKARDIANEGYSFLNKNELDNAESKFNEALKLHPDFQYAKDGLAKVKTKREAVDANKKKADDLVKEGNDLLSKNELTSAESKFNGALAIDKEHAEAKAGLQKVKDQKSALADQKTKVDGLVSAGDDLFAKKDFDGAEKEYNKALEIDKENTRAKAGLAKIAEQKKNLNDAAKKDDKDSTKSSEESSESASSEDESGVKADGSAGESTYEEPAE